MSFVGTPTQSGSTRDLLASVIQGEAGNQGTIGMTAVGAVIANRANSNFSGYGSTIQDQLLAHNQFQGQSTPTAQSYAVADNILSGNYTDPTGGATSYANPGASSAAWARGLNSSNSLQIGDHYFTDNQKDIPFTPNTGGASDPNSNMFDGNSGLSHSSDALGTAGGSGATSAADGSGDSVGINKTGAPDGTSTQGTGNFGSPSNAPADNATSDGTGSSATNAPTSKATDTGGGTPINITDPTKIAAVAGDTVSKALGGVTSGVASDTQSIEGAGTGWLNSIFSEGTDLLARSGFILLGLFLLLGALVFFYIDSKSGDGVQVVPVPV